MAKYKTSPYWMCRWLITIERGLLGIAVSKQIDGKTYVFLSYTESGDGVDGSDYTIRQIHWGIDYIVMNLLMVD